MKNEKTPPSPEAEAPQPPFTPTLEQQPSLPPQPSARELELERQLAEANNKLAQTPEGKTKAVKDGFKVPKGEEGYTHVVETKVNGETVEPRVRAYEPHQYDTLISKQHGYEAEIIHRGE